MWCFVCICCIASSTNVTTQALKTTKFELIRWFVPDLLTRVYWYTLSGCGPATIFRLSVQDVMFSTLRGQKQKSFLEWKELHSNSHPWEQLPQNWAQVRELGSTCSELSEDVGSFLRKLHGRFGGRRIRNRYGEGGLQVFRAQSSLILICSSMVKIGQLLIELGEKVTNYVQNSVENIVNVCEFF